MLLLLLLLTKYWLKRHLISYCRGTLHSQWLKRCESTGLTVNSGMAIGTVTSLNADGNTTATASLWQQLADCTMRVMLQREMHCLPELTDGLTALRVWVTQRTEGESDLRRWCLSEENVLSVICLNCCEHNWGQFMSRYRDWCIIIFFGPPAQSLLAWILR